MIYRQIPVVFTGWCCLSENKFGMILFFFAVVNTFILILLLYYSTYQGK